MENKIKLGELVKILDDILELDDAGGHWQVQTSPKVSDSDRDIYIDEQEDEITIGFIAPWGGIWIATMKNDGFNVGETAARITALHNNYGHILYNINSINKAMQKILNDTLSVKEIKKIIKDLYT